jgi:hypothetical protein
MTGALCLQFKNLAVDGNGEKNVALNIFATFSGRSIANKHKQKWIDE